MIAAYTPGWWVPTAFVINLYMLATSAAFLLWFRPKTQRGLVAGGMWFAAWAILAAALRGLSRVRPGGLAPRFSGWFDAATALAPILLMSVAITHWLIAQQRDRWERRKQS